ncbi:DUF397 domain-containing protein [Streptomyces sp. NPDC056160]|uniref:DUF397 domain-containing protein n=1 Tax=Streptomyces sp. NPDC056160 TaxID=3345731 RepID=UPI0035D93A84
MSTPQLHWFKSSYSSSGEPGDCVEVATTAAAVHVRDSKRPETSRLAVGRNPWVSFIAYVVE